MTEKDFEIFAEGLQEAVDLGFESQEAVDDMLAPFKLAVEEAKKEIEVTDYESASGAYTVKELKKIAKEAKIPKYSKMNEQELIFAIFGFEKEGC